MNNDESAIYVCALRYALGRATYITAIVSEQLINKWESISEHDRLLIIAEIKRAIHIGDAGHDCDIQNWQMVLDHDVSLVNDMEMEQ